MLRLAKAFWDIALWRARRRNCRRRVPAGAGGRARRAARGDQAHSCCRPRPIDLTRILLSVGLPLGVRLGVLRLARRQRFLQTGIALLGVGALANSCLYPLGSLSQLIGSDRRPPCRWDLLLIGLIWYLLACANIWRAALDSRLGLGVAVSVGYLLLSMRAGTSIAAGTHDACTCTYWASPARSWAASPRSPRRRDFASRARIATSIRR
jgi:hypothetical protein